MNKEQDQRKHDQLITWASVMFIVTVIIGFSINVNAQSSQQSGTACVDGSQYCENNSLDTTNNTSPKPVSYTHLTLPTIYSV